VTEVPAPESDAEAVFVAVAGFRVAAPFVAATFGAAAFLVNAPFLADAEAFLEAAEVFLFVPGELGCAPLCCAGFCCAANPRAIEACVARRTTESKIISGRK
jgi:hypothetical protein